MKISFQGNYSQIETDLSVFTFPHFLFFLCVLCASVFS